MFSDFTSESNGVTGTELPPPRETNKNGQNILLNVLRPWTTGGKEQ